MTHSAFKHGSSGHECAGCRGCLFSRKATTLRSCCSEFIDAEMDDYMNNVPDKQLSVDAEERTGSLPRREQ